MQKGKHSVNLPTRKASRTTFSWKFYFVALYHKIKLRRIKKRKRRRANEREILITSMLKQSYLLINLLFFLAANNAPPRHDKGLSNNCSGPRMFCSLSSIGPRLSIMDSFQPHKTSIGEPLIIESSTFTTKKKLFLLLHLITTHDRRLNKSVRSADKHTDGIRCLR